jgi:hypothetical protein
MARIIITGGFGKAFCLKVKEGETVIGREDLADLVLPNNSVSRRHASLSWDGQTLTISDLESRNGIAVNGKKTESAVMEPGSVAQIGKFQLTRVGPEETLFEGRFIQYMEDYTPAATASRSATTYMEIGSDGGVLQLIKETARVVVSDDESRFWIPGVHPLTFGGEALISIGGLFTGGIVAELTWTEKGHLLVRKKGFAAVKYRGQSVKQALLQHDDEFQVGNTRFIYQVPGL